MKKITLILSFCLTAIGFAQVSSDSTQIFKKRVLESTELDFLISYYSQDGDNAAVTGGVGTEELTDLTPTFVVSIPLNADDVLTIDAGVSAYTSASSSNLNPFKSGDGSLIGSPWVASSGASQKDTWTSVNLNYSHSSDDRNQIWSSHISYSTEYDYSSIGIGGGITRLYNKKNTEISLKGNLFFDTWGSFTPIELHSYLNGEDLNSGIFKNVDILNQTGAIIDKNDSDVWSPFKSVLQTEKNRNSYTLSIVFSQIINKRAQFSLFADIVQQTGWLANPMQRVYFADRDNYYVGNAAHIENYTSSENTEVFQLADDIERLPDSRFKIPIGTRFNYYINERLVLRSYYRFYTDDWGILSNTASIELPYKITDRYTISPGVRYYTQSKADYFGGYEELLSTSEFYTSDYDLSEFSSSQFSLGFGYKDIFTKFNIGKLNLKNIDFKYSYYERDSGLTANIFTAGVKFIIE